MTPVEARDKRTTVFPDRQWLRGLTARNGRLYYAPQQASAPVLEVGQLREVETVAGMGVNTGARRGRKIGRLLISKL